MGELWGLKLECQEVGLDDDPFEDCAGPSGDLPSSFKGRGKEDSGQGNGEPNQPAAGDSDDDDGNDAAAGSIRRTLSATNDWRVVTTYEVRRASTHWSRTGVMLRPMRRHIIGQLSVRLRLPSEPQMHHALISYS